MEKIDIGSLTQEEKDLYERLMKERDEIDSHFFDHKILDAIAHRDTARDLNWAEVIIRGLIFQNVR